MSNTKISVPIALFWIVLSTLFISGGTYSFLRSFHAKKLKERKSFIEFIIQTGPEKESLKTDFFSELFGLCKEDPCLFKSFDLKSARHVLFHFPLIKKAEIKLRPPNCLYIDYEIKKPIAYLGNYENMGIDEEGYLFPISPFLKKQRLPEIYLNEKDLPLSFSWSQPLKIDSLTIAFQLLHQVLQYGFQKQLWLKRVDVSNLDNMNFGRREIILTIENEITEKINEEEITFIFPHILRLHYKQYDKCLANYFSFRNEIIEEMKKQVEIENKEEKTFMETKVIDFRVPRLAFIK